MIIGHDNGYSNVKSVASEEQQRVIFASAVGEVGLSIMPNDLGFGKADYIGIEAIDRHWIVGDAVVSRSRQASQVSRERGWFKEPEYKVLILSAIAQFSEASRLTVELVTGLPILYYDDREELIEELRGDYSIRLDGRQQQKITLVPEIVLPQGLSAALSEVLDPRGRIVDNGLAGGNVGVIDIGGNNINFSVLSKLVPDTDRSTSLDSGMWHLIYDLSKAINSKYQGQDLQGHELIQVIKSGQVEHFGEPVDVSDIINDLAGQFTRRVIAAASNVWGSGARLSCIIIVGGGAWLIGPLLREHYRHAQVSSNPQWANALGYVRYGKRKLKG